MSNDYTPTTEQVRGGFTWDYSPENTAELGTIFDRWLTAHDTATRTAALEEAAVIARGNLGRIWIATETIHDIAEAILRA